MPSVQQLMRSFPSPPAPFDAQLCQAPLQADECLPTLAAAASQVAISQLLSSKCAIASCIATHIYDFLQLGVRLDLQQQTAAKSAGAANESRLASAVC